MTYTKEQLELLKQWQEKYPILRIPVGKTIMRKHPSNVDPEYAKDFYNILDGYNPQKNAEERWKGKKLENWNEAYKPLHQDPLQMEFHEICTYHRKHFSVKDGKAWQHLQWRLRTSPITQFNNLANKDKITPVDLQETYDDYLISCGTNDPSVVFKKLAEENSKKNHELEPKNIKKTERNKHKQPKQRKRKPAKKKKVVTPPPRRSKRLKRKRSETPDNYSLDQFSLELDNILPLKKRQKINHANNNNAQNNNEQIVNPNQQNSCNNPFTFFQKFSNMEQLPRNKQIETVESNLEKPNELF